MTTARRRRSWADVLINQTAAGAAQSVPVDLRTDAPATDFSTVVRLIGDLSVSPSDLNATSEGIQQIDLAIGVTSLEAFTAQVVPDPNVQADYPPLGWLYISTRTVIFNNSSGTTEKLFIPEFHFDVGANRKIDKGVLFMVWNNTNAAGGGFTVRMVGRVRSLALL